MSEPFNLIINGHDFGFINDVIPVQSGASTKSMSLLECNSLIILSIFFLVKNHDKPLNFIFFICWIITPLSSKTLSSFCPYTKTRTEIPFAKRPIAKFLILVPIPPEFPVFGCGYSGVKKAIFMNLTY